LLQYIASLGLGAPQEVQYAVSCTEDEGCDTIGSVGGTGGWGFPNVVPAIAVSYIKLIVLAMKMDNSNPKKAVINQPITGIAENMLTMNPSIAATIMKPRYLSQPILEIIESISPKANAFVKDLVLNMCTMPIMEKRPMNTASIKMMIAKGIIAKTNALATAGLLLKASPQLVQLKFCQ